MRGRVTVGLLLILLVAAACDRSRLPEVPAYEQLGFAATLEPVQRQVAAAYARWQERPRDALRNGHLGMVLSVYGRNRAAEALYRRARLLAPSDFRWTYYLAITVGEAGRDAEALALLREALEINPRYLPARLRLARLLLEINEVGRAAELYRAITDEYPERVEGWLGLGKALERSGELTAAAHALRRARATGSEYGEVHYALAAVLSASGDEQGAAKAFAAYERTAANSIRTPDPLLHEVNGLNASDAPLMARADAQLRQGQLELAAESLRAALDINPDNQDAWAVLVDTQERLGALDEAGATYRAALAAGIDAARLHLNYGRALTRRQRFDAARKAIVRAVESDPFHADAWLARGELELRAGAKAAAIEPLRHYLSLVPNDRNATLALAQALNATGQHAAAVARLQPLAAGVDDPLASKELALAYQGLGRRDEAIEALLQGRRAAAQSDNTQALDTIDALLADWRALGGG